MTSVLEDEISPAYKQQLEDKPSLANRARIYWVGGAAWATTSYTHPERATNRFAFLTRKDVRKFLEALKKDKWLDWTPPSGLDPKTAEKERQWFIYGSVFNKQYWFRINYFR